MLLGFFQIFDFLFEFFRLFSVGNQDGLIFGDVIMIGRIPHGFSVKEFRLVESFEGKFSCFECIIQFLLLKLFFCIIQFHSCSGMGDDSEILRGFSPDFQIPGTGSKCVFIELGGLIHRPFVLRFDSLIEVFNRGMSLFFPIGILIRSGERGERDREKNHGCPDFFHFGTLGNQHSDDKKNDREHKWIDEAVDRLRGLDAVVFLRNQGTDPFFECAETRIPRGGADIDPACFSCESPERSLVQWTVYDISVFILKCFESAFPIGDLNDGWLRGIADPRDEKRDFPCNDLIHSFSGIALEFIAVCDQHDGAMHCFSGFERPERCFESRLDIRSADRNGIRGKFIDRLDEACFIAGERTFQECSSGESDQTETVARIEFDEFFDEPFRMCKSARLNIFGEHAF